MQKETKQKLEDKDPPIITAAKGLTGFRLAIPLLNTKVGLPRATTA